MDLLLWTLIGVLGGNAVPHFVKGITKERYPCVLGNGPVPNFVAGWLGFVLTLLLVRLALNSRVSNLDLIAGLLACSMPGSALSEENSRVIWLLSITANGRE